MNKIIKSTYILAFLILLANCNSFAQKTNNYFAKIDSLIKTTNVRQFNGVILIAENGKIKYSKAYGFGNFEK